MSYNPTNWYWLADDGRLYSSSTGATTTVDNDTFKEWAAAGNKPTTWPKDDDGKQTSAALQEVLSRYGLFADLALYANARQWVVATGGYSAQIGGKTIRFETTAESRSLMTSKVVRLMRPKAPKDILWQTGPSEFVTIAAADFLSAAEEVEAFFQDTFDRLNEVVLPGIANGTISTRDQVDAAFT